MNCAWCKEPVAKPEQDPQFVEPMHLACGYRMRFGSVAHIERRCSCYVPGSTEGDDPSLSKREAALEAFLAGHGSMISGEFDQ